MRRKSYEDLHVWRESLLYALEVRTALADFPESERFTLGDPMRQAAASVATHIAEGHAGLQRGDFLRSLGRARGALARLHTLTVLSEQLGYLSPVQLDALDEGLARVSRPLQGLIGSLRQESGSGVSGVVQGEAR